MKPIIFLLVLSITTTILAQYAPTQPEYTARVFQTEVNKYATAGDRMGLGGMFANEFIYEACDKSKHNYEIYTNLLIRAGGAGRVITARADKRFVIYEVQYPGFSNEVMIRQTVFGWKFQRAQPTICL